MAALHHISQIGNCRGGRAKARIWIDLDNSPHVPFFAPIIEELQKRNYSVMVTARDCFQVRELAELLHLEHKLIGRHSGKNKIRKLAGLIFRALQLLPCVIREKPDLAISVCSRSQLILSALLRIPTLLIGDYEFSTAWFLVRPNWLMCPEVIPNETLRLDLNRVLKYPGIKEDIYVPRFVPTPGIRAQLGLTEEQVVVVLRPPASEAHYHNPQSDVLFDAVLDFLSTKPHVKAVLLPRNERQAIDLKGRRPDLFSDGKLRIPEHVVDGLNLMWHSDLVISGGGTMNREAAALGVPVYSIFRGKIGAVDQYLSRHGRLVLVESVQDVQTKIRWVRRHRPAGLQERNSAALGSVMEQIMGVIGAEGFSTQIQHFSQRVSDFGGPEFTK
jgi:uncharacterized protein